jgi:hypothetical protein
MADATEDVTMTESTSEPSPLPTADALSAFKGKTKAVPTSGFNDNLPW